MTNEGGIDGALRGMAELLERSANAKPAIIKQRLWAFFADRGIEIGGLKATIMQDLEAERRANNGRLRSTEYNKPPAKLRKQFERAHRTTLVRGTKASAPSTVRYELQGPTQRYRKDLTSAERSALERMIENYCVLENAGGSITASYEGMTTAGTGNARSGGVIDRNRLAYTTALHFAEVRLGGNPFLNACMIGLAKGEITVLDIGRALLPDVKDQNGLRTAGRAIHKLLAMECVEHEHAGDRRRTRQTLEAQITRELKAMRARRK